jgi:hypothetical protein
MAKKKAAQQDTEVRLDNLTLAGKEGWQRFVNTPARIPPEPLTRTELEALGGKAFDDYNRQRREWHANLGSIKTPQLAGLLKGFPGLGKAGIRCDTAHR